MNNYYDLSINVMFTSTYKYSTHNDYDDELGISIVLKCISKLLFFMGFDHVCVLY